MRWILAPLLAIVTLLLMACASERYEEDSPPHESWKDRGEYCFAVEVDPLGADNSTYFWADEVKVGYGPDGLSNVRAKNVRVSNYDWNDGPHNSKEDFYQPGIVRVIEDGSIEVDERCY